jgi:hypothetical protein
MMPRKWLNEIRTIFQIRKRNDAFPNMVIEQRNEKRNSKDGERNGADELTIVYLASDSPNETVINALKSIDNNDTQVGRWDHLFYRTK